MRTSNYVIYVPLHNVDDDVLLIHGYSGAYDRVSASVADYLRAHESGPRQRARYGDWRPETPPASETPSPSPETLALLARRGYLTTRTVEEEERIFGRIADALHGRKRVPAYVFMPTYDCNLRCPYCFQDAMRTDPANHGLLGDMTTEMVDRIFAAMPDIERQHGLTAPDEMPRDYLFFGGEPLLRRNRRVVEHVMARARALGKASFQAVTNATELDAYEDLLGPGGLAALQITIDGPPAEHDRRRIHADGSGSYAAIARNIDRALARDAYVGVRINVDRTNLEWLPQLAEAFVRHGWDRHERFHAYAAAVFASSPNTERETTLTSGELSTVIAEMRQTHDIMRVIAAPSEPLKEQIGKTFANRRDPLTTYTATYCSAHSSSYMFDALGDIYVCWEKTGDRRDRVGYVDERGNAHFPSASAGVPQDGKRHLPLAAEPRDLEAWRTRTVTSNSHCRRCRYAFYCGGGCAAHAIDQKGTLFTNFCDGFQEQFRTAAAQAYADHAAGIRPGGQFAIGCGA